MCLSVWLTRLKLSFKWEIRFMCVGPLLLIPIAFLGLIIYGVDGLYLVLKIFGISLILMVSEAMHAWLH